MDNFDFKHIPLEAALVIIAIFGGTARYLNGYVNGQGFKFTVFVSSVIVSGFGGLMFGWLGTTLNFSSPMLLMMAGMGGYFSEQTLKFIYEIIKTRSK